MGTIQVWIPVSEEDYYLDILEKLKGYYEKEYKEAIQRTHLMDTRTRRRHRIRKIEINDDFVIREAIKEWWSQIESRLSDEEERKEKTRKESTSKHKPWPKTKRQWFSKKEENKTPDSE
jgi:hypothetical protein